MSKRRKAAAKIQIPPAISQPHGAPVAAADIFTVRPSATLPGLPSPEQTHALLSHPDSLKDMLYQFGAGINPLMQYRNETNFFVRRRMLYEYCLKCTCVTGIADSISDDIAAQEIYITPTETNPSATTLLLAQRAVTLINHSMGKQDGILDFIKLFVESYWFSKTGAFILTPRDDAGNIQSIGILNPMQPYPYYDFQQGFMMGAPGNMVGDIREKTNIPVIEPQYDPRGNLVHRIQGIWYVDGFPYGANYFTLPIGHYHQIAPGAVAWGAFLDTLPKGEHALPNILAHTALIEYLLDTILCTDQSQAVVWTNVDPGILVAYSNKRKEIRRRRRNGEPVDPDDEGQRLHATAREFDKPADAKVINFRSFPQDFNIMQTLSDLETGLALKFGVNPRRAAPGVQAERFGNAQQASMLNSDEPGVKAIKQSLGQFYSSVLLENVSVRADFMASNTPENYALVSKDTAVAQIISQLSGDLTPEQKQAYLVRQGLLLPAEVGMVSMRTGDGTPVDERQKSFRTVGAASLRWPDGRPLLFEPPIVIDSRLETKARKRRDRKPTTGMQGDFNLDDDIQQAVLFFENWITNEMHHLKGDHGFSRKHLATDVDDVTTTLYTMMIMAAKSYLGNIRNDRMSQALDIVKGSWYNAMGSPALRGANLPKPQRNLFDALWNIQGKLALGKADIKDAQQIAATYTSYIPRYFNSLRTLDAIKKGETMSGPVQWVRHAEESCGDCLRFEGTYESFDDMMRRTGGMAPGDLRLTCSGNCKCELKG